MAFVIACHETEFGADYPDPAGFVPDERQRFLDSRARLLTAGAAHLDQAVAAGSGPAAPRRAGPGRWPRSPAPARRRCSTASPASGAPRRRRRSPPGPRRSPRSASGRSTRRRPPWASPGGPPRSLLVDAVTLVRGPAGHPGRAERRGHLPGARPGDGRARRAGVRPRQARRRWRRRCCPGPPGRPSPALRACLRRAVAHIDAAAAADRLAKAVRDRHGAPRRPRGRHVRADRAVDHPGRAGLPQALSAYAKACEFDEDGNRDPRSHQQRMADCLADLILRPHADHPAVQVLLTLVAGVDTLTGQGDGADEPGEVDGDLVPARPGPRTGVHARPAAPTRTVSDHGPRTPTTRRRRRRRRAGRVRRRRRDSRRLRRRTRRRGPDRRAAGRGAGGGGGAAGRLRRAAGTAVEADVGGRSASAGGAHPAARHPPAARHRPGRTTPDRGGRPADRHPARADRQHRAPRGRRRRTRARPATGHRRLPPTDPLYRFVRLRDRRCRFPGCRTRARCCDLDHQVPHPTGPPRTTTSPACANTTTGSPTRRRAGGCTATPTAAWSGPCPAAAPSPPARPPSAPTTAAPPTAAAHRHGSATPTRSPRSGTADRARRNPTSRSERLARHQETAQQDPPPRRPRTGVQPAARAASGAVAGAGLIGCTSATAPRSAAAPTTEPMETGTTLRNSNALLAYLSRAGENYYYGADGS